MNPVVHFEMPARDRQRMAQFYEKTFGWKTTLLGNEFDDYVLVQTVESADDGCPTVPGAINGGFYPIKPDLPVQYPSIVIAVDDITAAMKSIRQNAGSVQGEPMEIPGVGTYVSFVDTEGNRGSILQPLPGEDPHVTATNKK